MARPSPGGSRTHDPLEYTVVDADAHYFEPMEALADYVDEDDPWHERLEESPNKITGSLSTDHYRYGRIQRNEVGYLDGAMTPEDIPRAMEHLGLDKTIILSQRAFAFGRLADDRRTIVLANAFTDYLLDRVVDPDENIYTLVPVPFTDPEAAVDLIERVKDEPGIVGLYMIGSSAEPVFGHRHHDPIYAAAEAAGLPIVVHSGGSALDGFARDGYSQFIETHSLGFLENNMEHLTSLVIQGVPEKFPDLDFVFQESGVLWVAAFMYRLDEEYLKRQSEAPLLNRRPSEYVKEFYFGTQPMEIPSDTEYFQRAIETVGAGQFMYCSDYPHWDYDPPSTITDIPFLSEQETEMILGGTAEAVFGI